MKKIEKIVQYHEQSKHSPSRYAASLGYMDWSTQPDPFREYIGSSKTDMKLPTDDDKPTYGELFNSNIAPSNITLDTLSTFFRYSLGLAAIKNYGGSSWALRCNASSGNLHPTEAYALLPQIEGVSKSSSIVHYAPKNHSLELLQTLDQEFPMSGGFYVILSSIAWREVWKYGERAFRYCQLDVGHAYRAMQISAKMVGWTTKMLYSFSDDRLEEMIGLNLKERFYQNENEHADLILFVSTQDALENDLNIKDFSKIGHIDSIANRLSSSHHDWPIVESMYELCKKGEQKEFFEEEKRVEKSSDQNSARLILQRRSAQNMNPNDRMMRREDFFQIISGVSYKLEGMDREAHVSLLCYVHTVEELERGLYIIIRDEKHYEILKSQCDETFEWLTITNDQEVLLYRLKAGDFQYFSKASSCNQDIASEGSFAISMLSEFEDILHKKGGWYYRYLYYECGQIGQQLYLDATANGYSATGIGCFLDDVIHQMIGLKSKKFQVLYNFTIGKAITDRRIETTLFSKKSV